MSKTHIDAWLVKFNHQDSHNYFSVLSSDEKRAAKRFIHHSDRNRFIYRRGTIRKLLSKYLNTAPEKILIKQMRNQKPYLPCRSFFFNASSTHKYILFAITSTGEIGADIERKREIVDLKSFVNFVCTKSEADYLQGSRSSDDFFRLWTQKEAFLKGLGVGLSVDPSSVQTPIGSNEGSIFITQSNEKWHVKSFLYLEEYYFSIVFKNEFDTISLHIRD